MKTLIVIDCDDENQILSHITVIRQQIKRAFRKHLKNDPDYQIHPEFRLIDKNCYGDHEVIITEEDDFYVITDEDLPRSNYKEDNL